MAEEAGGTFAEVTNDSLTVSSSTESVEDMENNFNSEVDGGEAPEAKRSKAAKELGKAGGEASARAREERAKEAQRADEEPAKEEAKDEDETPGKLRRDDPRTRIQRLVQERAEERKAREAAEADRRQLEERLARLEGERRQPVEKGPGQDDGRPHIRPDQFEQYEAGIEDYVWKVAEHLQGQAAQAQHQQQVTADVETIQNFGDIFAEAAEEAGSSEDPYAWAQQNVKPWLLNTQPTFMFKYVYEPGKAPQPGPENDMVDAIIRSNHTAELFLYLSSEEGEQEAERILNLPNDRAVRQAVRRLERRVARGGSQPRQQERREEGPRPVSRARPPVRPLPSSSQASEEPGDESSFDEHMRYWNAKDRAARRR